MRTLLWAALTLAWAGHANAQVAERPGVLRMPTEDERVIALLRSSNPRDQAWGAWFAGRDHRRAVVPLLQRIVAARTTAAGGVEDRAAFELALDALIQMQAAVTPDLLPTIYERAPAQALILSSYVPREATAFLFEVLNRHREEPWFAAGNLLVPSPPPGFAVTLLREIKIQTHVVVTDGENRGGGIGGGFGGSGSGCGAGGSAPGLPPWPLYELTTYAQPGWVVLSWGPKPVFYRRTVAPAGQIRSGSVHVGAGPFPPDRLMYLAALLGEDVSQLPVQAIERRSVRWRGAANLQQEIERIKLDINSRLALLAHKLRERGLLEPAESSPFPHDPTEIVLLDFRDDRRTPLSR